MTNEYEALGNKMLQAFFEESSLVEELFNSPDAWKAIEQFAEKLQSAAYAEGRKDEAADRGWREITSAPDDGMFGKAMFLARAFNVNNDFTGPYPYTTDSYCVWRDSTGFARWPHPFPPTHWAPIPTEKPKDQT